MSKRILYPLALIAVGVILVASQGGLNAQQSTDEVVSIGDDDIGGGVTSSKGAEAGGWGIAETNDLQTKIVKIVVTDDGGHYVVPQLPRANYKIWVRGYGLLDSQPVQTTPGKIVNLTAVAA